MRLQIVVDIFNRKEDLVGTSVCYVRWSESLLEAQKSNKIILAREAIGKLDLAKLAEETELEQEVTARQGLAWLGEGRQQRH